MQKRWEYIIAIVFVVLLVLSFIYLPRFSSAWSIRSYMRGFGILGVLIYIVVVALSVPLPFPSIPFVLAGGYIYGLPLGMIIALAGVVLGSFVYFYIARVLGRPLVHRFVNLKEVDKAIKKYRRHGVILVLVSYAIPILPSDIISFALGFTRIKLRKFMLLNVLGHIPRVLLIISFGDDLHNGITLKTIILVIITLVALFVIAKTHFLNKFK